MKRFFFAFFLMISPLFSGSVRVINDSPYPLKAQIIANDGSEKGTLSLNPKEQATWQEPASGATVFSQTPYTIIFTCKSGKQFGVLIGVQQGATVTTLSSSGDRYCECLDKEKGSFYKQS